MESAEKRFRIVQPSGLQEQKEDQISSYNEFKEKQKPGCVPPRHVGQ